MNFSRRSFSTFSSRRPQWTAMPRLRRSAIPTTPTPFFRPVTQAKAMKIEPATPILRAA